MKHDRESNDGNRSGNVRKTNKRMELWMWMEENAESESNRKKETFCTDNTTREILINPSFFLTRCWRCCGCCILCESIEGGGL